MKFGWQKCNPNIAVHYNIGEIKMGKTIRRNSDLDYDSVELLKKENKKRDTARKLKTHKFHKKLQGDDDT